MSTALSTTVAPSTALEPTTIDQAFWLATQLLKSGLLGKSINKPEAAFAVILAGRELGLTAMQSLRSLHLIEGKPTLSSDLMAALVKRSPLCKSFKPIETTSKIATYETDRVGEGVTRMSFTMEEAVAAGVAGKDNWKKYPAAMLRARCIAALARAVYPDLLLGVYENDEIQATPNAMPSATVSATVTPIQSALPAAETPQEPTEDLQAVIDEWTARLHEAGDLDELETMRASCKSEVKDSGALLKIGVAYATAKKRLAS